MKYLYNHPGTHEHLHGWSSNVPLVRASFYFWIPGQQMQRSLEGLLQTLLYHILHACPDLVPILCPDRANEESRRIVSTQPWNLTELQKSFSIFRSRSEVYANFYFHVDGLDEYCGDSFDVIKTLQDLAACPNIKLCLSSRPWNSFQDAFGRSNPCVLRLHEWTRKDIEIFAEDNLTSYTTHSDFEPSLFSELIRDIVDRAQGVFLWVRLVVRSLRDGIINDDPVSILHERLRAIPTDLEEFFELILESVEDIYRSRMATTFLAALRTHRPLNMIEHYFLDQDNTTYCSDQPATQWPASKIRRAVDQTHRRLNGRFRGLLEPTSAFGIRHDTGVDFLHRTLRDFLKTEKMIEWLQSRAAKDLNVFMALSCALSARYTFVDLKPTMEDIKIAIELASHAVQGTGDTGQGYVVVDLAEAAYVRVQPKHLHTSCGIHCYILRFAIVVGHTGYLRYRSRKDGANLDLNRMLKHTVECRQDSDESFDPCVPETPKLHASLYRSKWGNLQDGTTGVWDLSTIPIAKMLLDLGADPNAQVDGSSSWTTFLHRATTVMQSPQKEQYKELLEVFNEGNLNLDSGSTDWPSILGRENSRSVDGLRDTLEYLQHLFSRGMSPNLATKGTTLFTIFLRMLSKDSLRLTGDRRQAQNEILRLFLRYGAEIASVYEDRSCDGWLNCFSQKLMSFARLSRPSTHVEDLQIFFEHGLDPNTILRGNITIWYRLLSDMHRGLQQTTSREILYHQMLHGTILSCLKYGADPDAPGLPRILDWTRSASCLLSADEMWQIEEALHIDNDTSTSEEDAQVHSNDGSGVEVRHARKRKADDQHCFRHTRKRKRKTDHGT